MCIQVNIIPIVTFSLSLMYVAIPFLVFIPLLTITLIISVIINFVMAWKCRKRKVNNTLPNLEEFGDDHDEFNDNVLEFTENNLNNNPETSHSSNRRRTSASSRQSDSGSVRNGTRVTSDTLDVDQPPCS